MRRPDKRRIMGFFARILQLFRRRRTLKLGLALGSGGAKGMAHLGAIKAFEEEGISFSVVAGTSIGSIVGALYAKGYSSDDMAGIVENLNRREFSRNLRPYADLSFGERFLENYLEGDFSSLPLPFAAWATDAETGEGALLSEGKLARALTASSAIPPFFRSVEIGGRRYYDGAFTNAIPADVCRDLGADIVVGIDLSAFLRPDEERGMASRLFGTVMERINPMHYKPDSRTRGYESADLMLRPALGPFHATDVSRAAMSRMFELGYEEAKRNMDKLKALIGAKK